MRSTSSMGKMGRAMRTNMTAISTVVSSFSRVCASQAIQPSRSSHYVAAAAVSTNDVVPGFPNIRRLREGSPIMRSACPTKCPESQREAIRSKLLVKTLVDLRTADERHGDPLPKLMWDEVLRVRQGMKLCGSILPDEAVNTEGVVLYNVPLYTTQHIMRWVFVNAPFWQKPVLLSSLPSVLGITKPDLTTLQIYNQSLSSHGLMGHNRFLLSNCGRQISAVLQLMCDPANLPMLFFCSLGKDRTGVISMLVLHIAGASRDEIKTDFQQSGVGLESVRGDIMAKLQANGLDPEEFISCRSEIMDDVFNFLQSKYGGVDAYLDYIGFRADWRNRLRNNV